MGKSKNTPPPSCDVPAIWLEHKKELENFIFKRVRGKELAQDICQEVLLKVYKYCLSHTGVNNLRSWLFQIARNTITDHYRKSSKFAEIPIPEVIEEDENLAYKEAVGFMDPILALLPEEYALPLRLSDIEGIKQAEVASKLGLSLPATKSRIQRARQLLKAQFIICCDLERDARGNLISFAIKDTCIPLAGRGDKKN